MLTKDKKISYPVNLTRYLSLTGIASRRNCVQLVKEGKISINKTVIFQPAEKVYIDDIVEYESNTLRLEKKIYIMLNKPKGYTCSNSDIYADKLALDLIDNQEVRLFTAGRLDRDSEGMLIITNDGDYVQKLMHPSNEIKKVYEVTVNKSIEDQYITEMLNGIKDEGEILKALKIEKVASTVYLFTLGEGKKREVRRLIKFAKKKTISLKRIRIGKLSLNNLEMGKWINLSEKDINLTLMTNT